ncbi:MAG: HAMP domain-containing histidine kinase [Candidatus Cloacimonetes bacterium]|nr:HAMP domain-containing histidine kinase [Candidatus Cloacimonadota bacterium]MCF7813978.1 HAMP domain-containing histidine kinase [Candidatus Cloacimonadota bacterium]MCF7868822.1 HAMP domain-containing histidine kinase [Candidatus Cloacimonadota bacterium]MCF7884081.1 HAMP domain-containing histidine kinase [Candidatus Cloacimonadota bacterium]
MKSGKLQKKTSRRSQFVTFYFILGSITLLIFFILYTNSLLRDIRKDVKVVPDLYSKFLGLPADVNLEHFLFQYFMEEIIPRIDYPIILVDSLKTPFSWENIDIENKEFEELDIKEKEELLSMLKKMEAQGGMIPLKFNKNDPKVHSWVYYGDSHTLTQLKMMPYIDMGLIVIFLLLGIYGIIVLKKGERNIIWVGLAKETAHQFGTPLSSLRGWIDIMEMKLQEKGDDPDMISMLENMKVDVDRLSKIASRFGKVGSVIKCQDCSLHEIIANTIEHFKHRLPTASKKIEIKFISKIQDLKIEIDPDLITWTLENMIKNAIDAMQQKGGTITVKAFEKKGKTFIHISDEGVGMPKSSYKKIFIPGTTSKARGWGLGLSLAKRIIEEYHKGKIRVLESEVGKGTTFEIELK